MTTLDRRQLLLGLTVGFGGAAVICAALSGDLPAIAGFALDALAGLLGGVAGVVIAHRELHRRALEAARAAYVRAKANAVRAAHELGPWTGPVYRPMRRAAEGQTQ